MGLTVAAALKVGFLVPAAVPMTVQGLTNTKPAAVRVRAKVDVAKPLTPEAAPRTAPAPRSAKGPPPARQVAVQSQAALATRTPPPAPPQVEIAPSIALEQPARVVPAEPSMPEVKLTPAQKVPASDAVTELSPEPLASPGSVGAVTGRPDAPPDDYVPPPKTFVEQAGGNVLVLGLLLDSKGRVLDLRILVPSYDGSSDLKYAMAVLSNQSFTEINPPIPAGESRWIETRVYYPKQTIVPNILP